MIKSYGWSEELQRQFEPHAAQGLTPGRVTIQQRGHYQLVTEAGDLSAGLSGRFTFEALGGDYPVAGDWVAVSVRPEEGAATIHAVLPRSTVFTRRASGPGGGLQIVAANVDVALLVASLNGDLNLRRIERYLAAAWESGAKPVVVLTKADACEDVETLKAQVEAIAWDVPVHAVSALSGDGLDALTVLLEPGRTAVLLGSSGVGKSTLLNALAGENLMATQAIREDDARGRHTTTHRELVLLPSGTLVLDTPGMRELGLWDADTGMSAAFDDVEVLVAACRFHDCQHKTEPGCAVQAALEAGSLELDRWRSYQKLQRELRYEANKDDAAAKAQFRKLWSGRARANRQRQNFEKRQR